MICPDLDTVNNVVVVYCDSEATADAAASSGVPSQARSPAASQSLTAGSIAAVCISLLVVFALLAAAVYYCRRRWSSGNGEYLAYTETSTNGLQQGDVPQQQSSLNMEV